MLDAIQPIVLVGGASRRFGRDKLREPVGEGLLVDRPIGALRDVFGPRVATVGQCHPEVAALADLDIPDLYFACGPAGGILSALDLTRGDVFVLAGDLPRITPATIRAILAGAAGSPACWAALARTDRIEPCIGLYRRAAIPPLCAAVANGHPLWEAIPPEHRVDVPTDPREAMNANTIEELRAAGGGGADD